MLVISVLIFHLSQVYLGMSNTDMLTLSYYMMGSTGVLAVIRACIPLNKGRVALIIYSVFGFLISSYYLRDVIEISTLNSYTLPIYLVAMAICTPLFFWISYKQGAFLKSISQNSSLVTGLRFFDTSTVGKALMCMRYGTIEA